MEYNNNNEYERMREGGRERERKERKVRTYSLGNSPRAKEQSNDVLPQAPGMASGECCVHGDRGFIMIIIM